MNVLPCTTSQDGDHLIQKVSSLVMTGQKGQVRWGGGVLLSTFGGHDAGFGGMGWEGWSSRLEDSISERVCLVLSFLQQREIYY
jgi:hypothetical protein